jgi:CheY-like chemotaxis protein
MTHDTQRLPMAVHHALRQMANAEVGMPTQGEIAVQARRIAELEALLEQYAANGTQRLEVASRSLHQAGQEIGAALDSLSHKLSEGDLRSLVEVRDRTGFQREIDRLKAEEIQKRFEAVAATVQPVHQWMGALKEGLAPQLESARALSALAQRIRPLMLMVDDDEFQHKLVKQLLADARLGLAFATSGIEALAMLRRRRPDIVLMDVNLPDIDGVEATRRLKSVEQLAGIPVVMVTGKSEKNVVVESLNAGASDFIVKPFDKGTLVAKIRKFLDGGSVP